MGKVTHLQAEEATRYCLFGVSSEDINRLCRVSLTFHEVRFVPRFSSSPSKLLEFDSALDATRARSMIGNNHSTDLRGGQSTPRFATSSDIIEAFRDLDMRWGRVGLKSHCVFVPTAHQALREQVKTYLYRDLKEWAGNSCTGRVVILSSTYWRRMSFANDEDHMLAQFMFT